MMDANESLRRENARLELELGDATGLINAIRNKIDQLNRDLTHEESPAAGNSKIDDLDLD